MKYLIIVPLMALSACASSPQPMMRITEQTDVTCVNHGNIVLKCEIDGEVCKLPAMGGIECQGTKKE